MTKHWVEGRWYSDPSRNGFNHVVAGNYEDGEEVQHDYFLPATEVSQLVGELEAAGYIKPRLDERLRVEDLKITHRLLDVIQTVVGSPSWRNA